MSEPLLLPQWAKSLDKPGTAHIRHWLLSLTKFSKPEPSQIWTFDNSGWLRFPEKLWQREHIEQPEPQLYNWQMLDNLDR